MVNESYGDFPWRISGKPAPEWFNESPGWSNLRENDLVKPCFRDKSWIDNHQLGTILERRAGKALVRWQDLSDDWLPLKYLMKTEPPRGKTYWK